jgi:hypothetical protein
MGVVMAGTSLLAAIAFTGGRRWIARHPASEAAFV